MSIAFYRIRCEYCKIEKWSKCVHCLWPSPSVGIDELIFCAFELIQIHRQFNSFAVQWIWLTLIWIRTNTFSKAQTKADKWTIEIIQRIWPSVSIALFSSYSLFSIRLWLKLLEWKWFFLNFFPNQIRRLAACGWYHWEKKNMLKIKKIYNSEFK